jgi:hypothetical protein
MDFLPFCADPVRRSFDHPMAMSSRRLCGGAGAGVVLSTLLITAGFVPQRHCLWTLLDWSQSFASFLPTVVSRQPKRTWLEEMFAVQPSMVLHDSGESFRGRHTRNGPQVGVSRPVRAHRIAPRPHGPMSSETESPKRIHSLVVPLHKAGVDVVEQLSFLVHAASSKLVMERHLLNIELELVVVASDRKDTAELRHLFPNLNEQIVWLDTRDAQQEYRATLARQEQWLRHRYPDDNVQLISTEATLNVAHPDRYVDTARHLNLLLRHQSESKSSPTYPPPSDPRQLVSPPFLVSTGKVTDAASLGTFLQQQRLLPGGLFRIDESACAMLRHGRVEPVSICTTAQLSI